MFKVLVTALIMISIMILDVVPSIAKESQTDKTPAYKSADLHLMYFRIEGTHCPICLARMGGYIRNNQAIDMAEISYHLPIECVIVYDKNRLDVTKLFAEISKLENVKFVSIEDSAISTLPQFIRPRPHKIESLLNPYMMP